MRCASGSCYEQSMFDDKQYVMEDGTIIKGIKAMLAHRMVELRKRLGYDIFIASSELDRDASEFAGLIAQCRKLGSLLKPAKLIVAIRLYSPSCGCPSIYSR